MAYMVRDAVQMQRLIEDLLAYASVGRSATPLKPVSLNWVLETVAANLSAVIEESEGRIDVGPLPEVLGHHTALAQLFQNLVGNALKFRGEGSPGRDDPRPACRRHLACNRVGQRHWRRAGISSGYFRAFPALARSPRV